MKPYHIRARIQKLKELYDKTVQGKWDQEHVGLFNDFSMEDERFFFEAHNIMPDLFDHLEKIENIVEMLKSKVKYPPTELAFLLITLDESPLNTDDSIEFDPKDMVLITKGKW